MTQTIHSAGDTIANRYKLLCHIGAGGMQDVYKANDLLLKRPVAVKVPKNSSAERRFKRSAILSARINHPNAAKTLDYLVVDGTQYLIEEFIPGEDLYKALERFHIFDPYWVAHVLHHLARGLAASHHVDIVHRDLKPSNIMVAPNLSFDSIKITDFGIAKMAQEELAEAAEGGQDSITGSHTMMGALPYMAPEMIKDPRTTGTPSDIWAVGALAYELLSGQKPFGKGLAAVTQIIQAPTPLLQELRNAQFSQLRDELAVIIEACLHKSPDNRPTADELVLRCGRLCYPVFTRSIGTVSSMPTNAYGFIAGENGSVFFHIDSVYGPQPKVGDTVYYSQFEGQPHPRAHPVIQLKT